jgi:hypothetical protein
MLKQVQHDKKVQHKKSPDQIDPGFFISIELKLTQLV